MFPSRKALIIIMPAKFIKIDSLQTLDSLFEQSNTQPVFLFKHSSTCGISADIHHQLRAIDGDVHIVVVQDHRPVSNAIASRTGIRHASPQAFVIKDGKTVYQASHYGIDPASIKGFL